MGNIDTSDPFGFLGNDMAAKKKAITAKHMSIATQVILFSDDDDIDKGSTLSPKQAKKIKKSVSTSGLLPAPRSKGDKPRKSKRKNLKKHQSALSFDTNIFAEDDSYAAAAPSKK